MPTLRHRKTIDRLGRPIRHGRYTAPPINKPTGRARAVHLYTLGPCELCKESGVDRHHKDGDTFNNAPHNIQILCRRCHMVEDGRLEAFIRLVPVPARPAKPCINCGTPSKPLRGGKCESCYSFFVRHKTDWKPVEWPSFGAKFNKVSGKWNAFYCFGGKRRFKQSLKYHPSKEKALAFARSYCIANNIPLTFFQGHKRYPSRSKTCKDCGGKGFSRELVRATNL